MTYKVDGVVLDGGLDFRSPKSLVKPGSLLDCKNYEIVDRSGYKRIDGFFRYNGNADIVDDRIYVLDAFSYVVDSNGDRVVDANGAYVITSLHTLSLSGAHTAQFTAPPIYLYVPSRYSSDFPFGLLVGTDTEHIYYLKLNPEFEPRVGDSVRGLGYSTSEFLAPAIANLSYPLEEHTSFDPVDIVYPAGIWSAVDSTLSNVAPANINGYFWQVITSSYWYSAISAYQLPGNYMGLGTLPITGMHWFDDRLHTITDPLYLDVDHLISQPKAGDTFYVDTYQTGSTAGISRGQVLYAELLTSTNWTTNDTTTARIWYRKTSVPRLFNENSNTPYEQVTVESDWASGIYTSGTAKNLKYDKNGATFATTVVTNIASANGAVVEDAPIGVLWKTHSEIQGYEYGAIMNISISNVGSGYTRPPIVTIADSGGGYGATAYATITGAGALSNIIILTPGRGYTSATTVTISGGGGSNGAASATISDWRYAGTRFVDTGWTVGITAGSQKSGYLPRINRNWNSSSQAVSGVAAVTPTLTGVPNKVLNYLDFPGATNGTFGIGNWYASSGTFLNPTFVQSDNSNYFRVGINSTQLDGSAATTATLGFINFSTVGTIPENAVITGVKVVARCKQSATISSGTPNAFYMRASLFKTSNSDASVSARTETLIGSTQVQDIPDSASYADLSYGGDGDLWGFSNWSYTDFSNPDFGVALDITMDPGAAVFDFDFQLDTLELVVYYQQPNSRYYFKDAAGNIIQADLVDYDLASGSFQAGDAVGTLQLANVVPITTVASNVHTIISSMTMYGDAACATTAIATTTSDMAYNGLPSRQDLIDNDARFEFLTANFTANKDHLAMFGVSGSGRAFTYDGSYFQKIYAFSSAETNSSTKDKPRHIGFHRFKLALGYDQGSVILSNLGDPLHFSGLKGAVEIGIGERITGLASLQGTYLAVFTNNAVYGLQGDSLNMSTLSPTSGAIDYTVVSAGDRVIFCDSRGISTLDQSDKYGDFEGFRFSHAIAPWLSPRLSLKGSTQSGTTSDAIAFAYARRSHNQYRLWFKDGTQLWMSLVGSEQEPQFTIVKYVMDQAQTGQNEYTAEIATEKHYPLAMTSVVDTFGKERTFFGSDAILLTTLQQVASNRLFLSAMFEVDKFSGFDAVLSYYPIPAYVVLNHYYVNDPFKEHTVKKVRLEGASRGVGNLMLSFGKDYTDPEEPTSTTNVQDISIPDDQGTGITDSYVAYSNLANTTVSGRNVLMRFDNAPISGTVYSEFGPVGSYPEQAHYLQLLLIHAEEGRDDA